MRNATDNQYPRFLIWENVRGALSSNEGKDFYAAIQAMAKLGALDVSYRLVNACHFGVPQRRVRVFVVADLTGQLAGEILAQPTRLLWHPSSIGEQRQEASGEVEKSTRRSKWKPSQSILAALPQHVAQGADDNCAQGGYLAYSDKHAGWTKNDLASSVCVKWAKGTGGPSGSEHYNLVLETETLNRVPYVKTVRSGKRDDEGNLPAEQWAERQVAPTLNLMDNGGETRATVLAVDGYNQKTDERLFHALRTEKDSGDSVLDTTYRVRRLTPVECERLMGWPDDHTRYDDKGNELSDTARYKMCGNGIATPVARWLCENLVSSVLNEKQANPS
jgi:DNA (cytosine-5)-methyltransferase 1